MNWPIAEFLEKEFGRKWKRFGIIFYTITIFNDGEDLIV